MLPMVGVETDILRRYLAAGVPSNKIMAGMCNPLDVVDFSLNNWLGLPLYGRGMCFLKPSFGR
jgi:hypothetical protein